MIGFFDSGFGGLTILRSVVELLPGARYWNPIIPLVGLGLAGDIEEGFVPFLGWTGFASGLLGSGRPA